MLEKLKNDLKTAMKARNSDLVGTIRLLISEINNEKIAKGRALSEEEILVVITREAKKRREAIELYSKSDRDDLKAQEELELGLIKAYLPEELTEEEVRNLIQEAIAAVNPQSQRDMGKVMGKIMPSIRGRFDGKVASGMVRSELQSALAAN